MGFYNLKWGGGFCICFIWGGNLFNYIILIWRMIFMFYFYSLNFLVLHFLLLSFCITSFINPFAVSLFYKTTYKIFKRTYFCRNIWWWGGEILSCYWSMSFVILLFIILFFKHCLLVVVKIQVFCCTCSIFYWICWFIVTVLYFDLNILVYSIFSLLFS